MLGIYLRLSREDDKSNSIKNQLIEAEKFAKSKKLKYKVYNEGEGLSGKLELEDRPQLKALYEDIIEGKIDTVWFRDTNRLSRNVLLYHQFIDLFRKHNVDVYFTDEKFNYYNPTALAMGSIKATFDELKILEQSLATKKAISNRLKRGLIQGTIPFGYTKDENKKLIINESEAEIVKLIYQWSFEGVGMVRIADKLTKMQVVNRYASFDKSKPIEWSHSSIKTILTNPIYKGVRFYGGKYYECPAIFTTSYFDKVDANRINNRRYSGKQTFHKYLLSGLLTCGVCGKNYSGKILRSSKTKVVRNYYVCNSSRKKGCGNKSIKLEFLDELIWTKFIGDGRLSKLINNHFKQAKNNDISDSIKRRLNELKSALKRIKKSKDNLIQLASEGVLSHSDIKSKMSTLKQSENDTEIKIENAENKLKAYSSKKYTKKLEDVSVNVDYNTKQEILKSYLKNITIDYDRIDKHYSILIEFTIDDIEPIEYIYFNGADYVHQYPVKDDMEIIYFGDEKTFDVKILYER